VQIQTARYCVIVLPISETARRQVPETHNLYFALRKCWVPKDQFIVSFEYITNRLVYPQGWTAGAWTWLPIPPSAKVKNEWSFASILPIRGHGEKRARNIHLFAHFSPPFKFILLNLICMEPGIVTRPRTARPWNLRSSHGRRNRLLYTAYSPSLHSTHQTTSANHHPPHLLLRASDKRRIAPVTRAQYSAWGINYSQDGAVIWDFGCMQEHDKCCHLPGQRWTISRFPPCSSSYKNIPTCSSLNFHYTSTVLE
jgi:hypothetical protein